MRIDGDLVLRDGEPVVQGRRQDTESVATAMAGQLGVSIQNVAEGLGTLGRKGMEGAGSAVEGVGSAFKRLFGH